MVAQRDVYARWSEAAQINWFSQFIKAWIPFNAWMSNCFGDLTDRELIEKVQTENNDVRRRIKNLFAMDPKATHGGSQAWRIDDDDANMFRQWVYQLHVLLNQEQIEGRKGIVSFSTVDIGYNNNLREQITHRRRQITVTRNQPTNGNVLIELTSTSTQPAVRIELDKHDETQLSEHTEFQALKVEYQSHVLSMFKLVSPRRILDLTDGRGGRDLIKIGNVHFVNDPDKLFSGLVHVLYQLRCCLFHGTVTPDIKHGRVYEPAYNLVMRFVDCVR